MRIHFHLNDPLLTTLNAEAERTAKTRSDIIRESLAATLPKTRSISGTLIKVTRCFECRPGTDKVAFVRMVPDAQCKEPNSYYRLDLRREAFGDQFDTVMDKLEAGCRDRDRVIATGVERLNPQGELTMDVATLGFANFNTELRWDDKQKKGWPYSVLTDEQIAEWVKNPVWSDDFSQKLAQTDFYLRYLCQTEKVKNELKEENE